MLMGILPEILFVLKLSTLRAPHKLRVIERINNHRWHHARVREVQQESNAGLHVSNKVVVRQADLHAHTSGPQTVKCEATSR